MACDKQHGIRNISITFTDCDTEQTVGPLIHKLAEPDTLPTYTACTRINTALTAGYTSVSESNASITMSVIRNKGIPMAWYQGCASVDVQIEWLDGKVVTGVGGAVTEPDESDGHTVAMTIIFEDIDELLPDGALAA
jgi:hypothetical protein